MERKSERALFSGVIYLSLIFGGVICAAVNGMGVSDTLLHAGYGLIVGWIFMNMLHLEEDKLWKQIPEKRFYLLTTAFSFCAISVASRYPVGMFWLLPLAVTGCLAALEIKFATFGMVMVVYLFNALMVHEQIQQMIYYLVMGTAFLMILSMIQKRQEIPYAGVILLALSLALLLLGTGFDLSQLWDNRYAVVLEIASLIFLLSFATALQIYRGFAGEKVQETVLTLSDVLQEDFPLLLQLKEKRELYRHCHKISCLSYFAAGKIGCDTSLAKAGGMYHEVGRLLDGENYMEANLQLARRYHFPDTLTGVIRQHNTGSEIPKSPEAAIVMLSDCIISTGEYLAKSGKRNAISDEKLIKSIFSNRIAKGSLAESGLTDEQLEQLQDYFVEHAFSSKEKEQVV